MAYRLFDQRVVNPLERPVSEDPNTGLSQDSVTLRDMLGQLYELQAAGGALAEDGFVGDGFKPVVDPLGRFGVVLTRGIGFKAITSETQAVIGGVAGVSDLSDIKPLVLHAPKFIDTPAAPPVGQARRDVIAVRWTPHLTDSTPSRVFNTGTQSFSLQSKFKTLTWDLYNYLPVTLSPGGSSSPTIEDPIIYAPGVAGAYDSGDPDTILSQPLPSVPDDYAIVAVINVVGGATAITASDIVDYRRRVFPGGAAMLYATPTIGAEDVLSVWLAGQVLSTAEVKTPNQLKAFISKRSPTLPPIPSATHNEYQLTVIGARNAAAFSLQALPRLLASRTYQPVSIAVVNQVISESATADDCATWSNSVLTPEGGDFAIGQPYSAITFRAGTSELGSSPYNLFNTTNTAWNADGATLRTIQLMLQATLLT